MKRASMLVLAALMLAGCAATDPMTASINPTRQGEAGPSKAKAMVGVADAAARAGDLTTAASLYRRAHAADPKNFDAVAGLGRSLARLGASEEAAAAWRAALRLRRHDAGALRGLGNALIAMGQPAQAVPLLKEALKRHEDARTYSALGVAHDMLGDHGAAQAYYRTGLEAVPDDLDLSNNLGLSLAISGQYAEAIRIMRRTVALPGAGLRHRMNLALVLGLAGKTKEAAEIIRAHMGEQAVQSNLAYYAQLRALHDQSAIAEALGVHYAN